MHRRFGFASRAGGLAGLCLVMACGGAVSPDTSVGDASAGGDGAGGQDSGSPDAAGSDGGSESGSDSGGDAGTTMSVPIHHRPDDSQCSAPAPPGDCSFGGSMPQTCGADDQCTTGTNGRCVNDGPVAGCHCTYDACTTDSDCATGQLCVCHGSAYSNGAGNTCMPGNCRIDSDCGAHGYCSPTTSSSACGGETGYYCHTSSDQCENDTDCSNLDVCEWSASDGRWECVMEGFCG